MSGTVQNRAALYAEILTTLAAGQPNGINAAQLQAVLNDLVASAANLNDSNASVSLTYTGTPITNINLQVFPSNILVLGNAVSGAATYQQESDGFQVSCLYNEGGITTGNTLTSLTFNDLLHANTITITNCANLTSLSWPVMTRCMTFTPGILPSLTTLSAPNLASITTGGNFSPSTMASLASLSFPALTYIAATFNISTMVSLTSASFPALTTISGGLGLSTSTALTTFSLPSLTTIGGAVNLSGLTALTTFSLPSMVNYGGTIAMNSVNGNLTSVTLGTNGTLLNIAGASINIQGQKLTAASVNAILSLLVSLNGSGGTTLWGSGKSLLINGGTNASPSGQGITDKATLIGRGVTVTTN